MKFADITELALSNLTRSKLRAFLTTLGVVIGIGALVAMVSFGTGMQKNVSRAFEENDLFTSLFVTPQKIDFASTMSGDVVALEGIMTKPAPVMNDSVIAEFRKLDGVLQAFPQIQFPVKVKFRGRDTRTTLNGLPAEMGNFAPFNKIPNGKFFESDSEYVAVISPELLADLNLRLREEDQKALSLEDSSRGMRTVAKDSILGAELEIITTVMDASKISPSPFGSLFGAMNMPVKDHVTTLKISGILKERGEFHGRMLGGSLTVPAVTADRIPRFGFNSVWDLLKRDQNRGGHGSVYVRAKRVEDVRPIKQAIEDMGFGAYAIIEELDQMRQFFLIFDMALGAIGTIALIVAALGIINTMVMSILERRREIGVMKSVGGSESEIRTIFFIEAGAIGVIGGLFGLVLGWLATRVANLIANVYLARQDVPHVEFFYIPLWLIFGALAFSVIVSLLAGVYPASRAARVDPVEALRHD
ncbi:ABC transporter permease [candidate division KSB1 bacterium]|nr:ABC transporter permease [candidate division KSB1 bacterium]